MDNHGIKMPVETRFTSTQNQPAHATHNGASETTASAARPLLTATELLHDLRSGAFLSAQDARAPFKLTERARIANEMMELMHLLDRMQATQLREFAGAPLDAAALREAASKESLPMLPNKAVNAELPSILENLLSDDRILRDQHHNPLFVARDGTPLKLDDLVWHAASGDVHASIADSTPLSPLLI